VAASSWFTWRLVTSLAAATCKQSSSNPETAHEADAYLIELTPQNFWL